jgi:hypothetical protein
MEVGMVHEVLSPGVEDGREAQLGLEALLAELEEGGAGALKEQAIERGLVLEDECGRKAAGRVKTQWK